MSLINDALKKAQRERAGQLGPLPTTSGATGRRGMSSQTMMLLGIGALVLVCLSVVFTVFLTSSPAPSAPVKPAPIALTQQKMGTAPAAANTSPAIVFPSSDKAAPAPAAVAAASDPATAGNPGHALPAPATPKPAITAAAAPTSSKTPDQIQAMVDGFRVSGVRSSASGSKVLMNDHIVKLQEVVDRETGLKLVKIDDDVLTFEDANGSQYKKNF